MSVRSLRFRAIDLRRMPGFERGGPRLADLADGVTLIHGPNAAGKSTLARSLQMALWPRLAPPTVAIEARFELDGEVWEREIDAGTARLLRGGAPVAEPDLPPRELAARYLLAIDSLLVERDSDLASAILRESAGGYDLDAAARACEFHRDPKRPQSLADSARSAAREVSRIVQAHQALRDEELRLQALEIDYAAALEAAGEQRALELALEVRALKERVEEAEARLVELPPLASRVNGSEVERLEGLIERATRGEREQLAVQAELNRVVAERARLELPRGVEADRSLPDLEARISELEDIDRTLAQAESERAQAEAELARALETVGPGGNVQAFRAASLSAQNEGLAALLDRAARRDAERALLERLDPILPASHAESKSGSAGATTDRLRQWLAAPDPRRELLRAGLGLFAAGVLAGCAYGLRAHPLALVSSSLAALAMLVSAGIDLERSRRRGRLAAELLASGLSVPTRWREPEVRVHLRALEADAETEREQGLARRWRAALALNERSARALHEAVEAERARLAAELGLAPAEPLSLVRLAERLRALDEAADAVAAVEARQRSLRGRRDEAFGTLSARLAEVGAASPRDRIEARATVQTLFERLQSADRLRDRQALLERELGERIEAEAERLRERRELFARLGLADGAEAELRAAVAAHGDYLRASEVQRDARRDHQKALAELGDQRSLATLGAAELRARLEGCRQRADDAPVLAERMIQIRTRVADARAAHDLEEARARHGATLDALRADRASEASAVVGWFLAQRVGAAHRERGASPILQRARELFARFTRHRYRLELEKGEQAGLAAFDTTLGRTQPLATLSSGTRVQLLLAVRIAFLEHQERGLALPLFLDEALATSDEERASAVISTVSELASEGRQILCFTAQAAEVSLWHSAFARSGSPLQVVSLAALPPREPVTEVSIPRREIPAAGALDRAAFARAVGVPAFDPWHEDLGGLHLWYLIHDPVVLTALLRAGIDRWGPLCELAERGDVEALAGGAARETDRAKARARLLSEALMAWKIGRGRPVDRPALAASGAVSGAFIDAVSAEAVSCAGDAKLLLRRLESGAVKNFRSGKVHELERFLEENGFLDPREPLTSDSLRARVYALAAPDLLAARFEPADVETMLALLSSRET